jgi:hypothetical protein
MPDAAYVGPVIEALSRPICNLRISHLLFTSMAHTGPFIYGLYVGCHIEPKWSLWPKVFWAQLGCPHRTRVSAVASPIVGRSWLC